MLQLVSERNSVEDQDESNNEIKRLLDELQANNIVIKLNKERTLLCLECNSKEYVIENDGKIIEESTYNKVRTTLQNKIKPIPESTWDQNFKVTKQQFLAYLIKEKTIEDNEGFLNEFNKFINDLPEVPDSFIDCKRRILKINFDDWDEDDNDDERLKELQEIHQEMLKSFNEYESLGEDYINKRNESVTNATSNIKEEETSLPFEKQYPKQSNKVKRIFEILNSLERCDQLDHQVEIIAGKLGLNTTVIKKLIDYINAADIYKTKTKDKIIESSYCYRDDDINRYAQCLEKYGVDVKNQFTSKLFDDGLPSLNDFKDNLPRYICYTNKNDNHWIAMFIVKQGNTVTVLYKDSKQDETNNYKEIEAMLNKHFVHKVELIKHPEAEQEDKTSSGPMALNNLEIMAKIVKDEGISKLIESFKGDIIFTKEEQVKTIRNVHLKQIQSSATNNSQQDETIENLSNIISKTELIQDKEIEKENLEVQKKDIESYIHKINYYYENIKDWDVDELNQWTNKNKGKLTKSIVAGEEIFEAIAVMDRANELATKGHRLRDTQKTAILIFMQTDTMGHISQINTGEGKTTIISVVSALKVMQGYKTHIITSNNVLAADGAKDKSLFYYLLNITVADNNPDDKYTDGPRSCYSKDVVYGSITSFQFDWLRDSFEQLKTLDGLDYSNVWVMLDEIDSLLIDQGSNIAKLSGPFPGMESLRYVYINIWVSLAKAEELITNKIVEKLQKKANELATDTNTDERQKQHEYEKYEDNLRETFLDEVKAHISSIKDSLFNKQIIASHLHQYAEDNLNRWIENAFAAKYQYNQNVEYKITKDKKGEKIIIPVDNQNTGVSMKNTILSNGLHQFLQIKHNLCLTYESLTSCYVSNLDYIKKYGSKLSGVTGTLGSVPERNLLGSIFNLGFSIIPPFKPKQFLQFPGKVCTDDQFVNDVAIAALGELTRINEDIECTEEGEFKIRIISSPRAVLIVCASILDVELIYEVIDKQAKAAGLKPKINKYIDETDVHVTERTLDINDIVIATNLAGRGTDFKTSVQLEFNGGLHVIEAFLPCNKRVEDQGLGRTGRQGNKGTGQIIVRQNEVELLGIKSNASFEEIMKQRDELETLRVNDIAENKVTELKFKGQLFDKFASDYAELKSNHKTGIGSEVIKWKYVLKDLKEKWAFWLEKQEYTATNIKEIILKQQSYVLKKETDELITKAVENEYNEFLKEAKSIINGTISHNPYYSICLAERYLENCTNESDRKNAKYELNHAINLSGNSDLLFTAYIKLFEIAIDDGGQMLKRYKKAVANIFCIPLDQSCPEYKEIAVENLKKASNALEIEYKYLEELIQGKGESNESVLSAIIVNENPDSTSSTHKSNESVLPETIVNENPDSTSSTHKSNESVISAIIVNENPDSTSSNIFIKHLQSRLVCLGIFKGNIESLMEQIKAENRDGIIIDCKVPRYLSKLDSQNEVKKYITDKSVDELEFVGASSIYQVRKIHDVPEMVLRGAQIQIAGGLVLLAEATLIPILWPVYGPLAGAMISEGVTDIITSLINQGQTEFNKKDYIKGKVISYGITVLTMGIGALMSSTKILNKAVNACRYLATKLRNVKGPFAGICKFLANRLDKLADYLEKMIEAIEFARKTAKDQAAYLSSLKDLKQLERFQKLQKTLKLSDAVISNGRMSLKILTQSVIGAVKGVIISVAIEKIVIATLSNLMAGLQPIIKAKVGNTVKTKMNEEFKKGTFNNMSDEEINQIIKETFETSLEEDITDVCKEIGLGIMRHSSNWKMQLITLAGESILSGIDMSKCTNNICNKFITKVSKHTRKNDKDNDSVQIENIIMQITEQVSSIIYNKLVSITGKVVVTLPKALYRGYQAHQEDKADKKAITEMTNKLNEIDAADKAAINTKCAHDAVGKTLGQDSKQLADGSNLGASTEGASIDDVKNLYKKSGFDAVSCNPDDAVTQFEKQGSDRGVVCLNDGKGIGHTVPVSMEGGSVMVNEGGKKIPLNEYKQSKGYTNAELIIPKNVKSSNMKDVQYKCNINRIIKATHPIGFVGKGDGMKYGTCWFTTDSVDPNEIGQTKGDWNKMKTRQLFNMVECNQIKAGAADAHSIYKHVGKVKDKTSFTNKDYLFDKYDEVMDLMRSKKSAEQAKFTINEREMPGGKGIRQVINARVKKFFGFDDKQSVQFKNITIIRDKPEGRRYFLPQTVYPSYRPKT